MSTTTKKPRGPASQGVSYKNVAKAVAWQISHAHIDIPIFASDPTNAQWKARYGVDVKLSDVYSNSASSYALLVCTVVGSSPTWASIGAAASVTLQAAFTNGKAITGANSSANAVKIGDGTDDIYIFRNGANDCQITTVSGSDLTIAPADDLVLAPTGGDTAVTGTLDVSSTFTVATNKLSVNATTGTVTSAGNFVSSATTGNAIAINTNKFLVAADTGNTTIAGDCAVTGNITGTFAGTWGGSTWNANPVITVSATTGQGLTVAGGTVTSGDVVYLSFDSSLTGAGGYILRAYNTTTAANALSVASDGAVTIAGTAGSAALTLSAGSIAVTGSQAITGRASNDVLMSLTRSGTCTGGNAITIAMGAAAVGGNAVGISWGGAGTGDAVAIDMTNNVAGGALVLTGAGTRTDNLIEIVDVPNNGASTISINATTQHNSGHVIDIDIAAGSTHSCNVIDFATAAAYTGDVIKILMNNAGAGAQALVISSNVAATSPMIDITSTGAAGGNVFQVASTSSNADGGVIQITESGTVASNLIELAYGGAHIGDAINVTMNGAGVGAQALVISSNVAATSPMIQITSVGAAGGNVFEVASTSAHANGGVIQITENGTVASNLIELAYGGANTGDAINVTMNGAGAASQALVIASNVAHSGNVVSIAGTGSLAGGTGKLMAVTYGTGTLAVATSGFMLDLVDTSAATATSYCLHIASTSNEALYVETGVAKFAEAISADAGMTSTGRITTTDGVGSGTAKVVGGRAYAAIASGTTHTNTTDETVLGSYTIPANTLKQGTTLKVRFGVICPSTNAADTYTVRLRLGETTLTGTALLTTASTDVANNNVMVGDFQLTARAAPGAAAECVGCGLYSNFGAVSAGAGGAAVMAYLVETNFITNGNLLLEVTGDWSAANAADQAHLDFMYVEVV